MKNQLYPKSLIGFVLIIILSIASCEKSSDDTPNIAELVSKNNDFSTLNTAVINAGLVGTLSGTGPYTLFAPNNDAFATAGLSVADINNLSATELNDILLYHVIPGKIISMDLPVGPNAKIITANGDSVFVTKNNNGIFINGIKIFQADLDVTNGIVHKINSGILMPAEGDIVNTISSSNLDSLVKAVTLATTLPGGDPTLLETLSTKILTVFAPSNEAFTKLMLDLSLTDISQIPIATLVNDIKYHVVEGRRFSSDLNNGSLTMLTGGTSTINISLSNTNGTTITGSGNGENVSNIYKKNLICTNGVVHLIDKVLLP